MILLKILYKKMFKKIVFHDPRSRNTFDEKSILFLKKWFVRQLAIFINFLYYILNLKFIKNPLFIY